MNKAFFVGLVDVMNGPGVDQVTLITSWLVLNTDDGTRKHMLTQAVVGEDDNTEDKVMNRLADSVRAAGFDVTRNNVWTFSAEAKDPNIFDRVVTWFKTANPDIVKP